MNQLDIIWPTILKEWKTQRISTYLIYKLIADATRGIALAWIIYQSGNFGPLAYLCIGVALLALWTGSVANSGWSLSDEISGRTMEHTLISRTSMPILLFSKILSQIAYEFPSAVVSIITVILVVRQVPQIASPEYLPVSLILAIFGLVVLSVFLASLVVLVGGRAGFFMGIVPLGAVLGGFMLPVNQLPIGFEIVARMTPTAWAMNGTWLSVSGVTAPGMVWENWGMSILLITVWFTIDYYLCRLIEKRIRVMGTLGSA